MKIHLPTDNFAFFKVISGSAFLASAIAFPVLATYSFIIALAVGRAHGIGAWLAMWRAGKLNWRYVISMFLMGIAVAFFGLKIITSLTLLAFITNVLFSFHFFFDEFDLQEEKRLLNTLISSLSPSILMFLYLFKDYFHLNIDFNVFIVIATTILVIEIIHTQEISWFFIHTKVLTLFILSAMGTHMSSTAILSILLIFHYFFWFVYPVYKIHKYKPEDRDGFIMILILLVSTAVYFAITRNSYGEEVYSLAVRAFFIGTIVHILSTAPFGHFFGLPKKKYSS